MTTRRLAAIMAADIAGYSRLMHADEEPMDRTLAALATEELRRAWNTAAPSVAAKRKTARRTLLRQAQKRRAEGSLPPPFAP